MDSLPKLINQYPDLLIVSKPSLKNSIFYNEERYNPHFVESLISIYKFYFEIDPLLIIPKYFESYHPEASIADLEYLENIKENKIIIFAYADILFNDIIKINKRRLNTIIKNCSKKAKVIILSITTLKSLELPILETFHLIPFSLIPFSFAFLIPFSLKNLNISLFDLIESDPDTFKSNVDSFVEMINDFKDKKIYISLSLPINKILYIETKLKEISKVFRKEPEIEENGIVINSSKTTQKSLLKYDYDIYIFSLPNDLEYLDILYYFKDIFSEKSKEIYIDSSNNDNVEKSLMKLYNSKEKLNVKDSKEEYDTFESIKLENKEDAILATDDYYNFESPESIQNMDLCNLTKKDYDTIRNYIKLRLNCKFDLDVKTCQLSTPCSPKDRSRKLNSLSNKISSIDYRCDITCEIFKDYTIGVIIWNEIFNSKEKINILKNETYIYQTTSGKWKFTKVC